MNPRILPPLVGSTFLKCPQAEAGDITPNTIAITGMPLESTKVSRPGAKEGPQAIREATFMLAYSLQRTGDAGMLDASTGKAIRASKEQVLLDVGDLGLYPADVHMTTDIISDHIQDVTERGGFPVSLGGDHYIAYPCFRGFVAAHRQKIPANRIGYIHVDAHLDLAHEMPFFGGCSSGTLVRRMTEIPGIDPRNFILIGIGGLQPRSDWDFAHQSGMQVITRDAMQAGDLEKVVRDGLTQAVGKCDAIYLSVDIDVNDRTYAPGTGNAMAVGGLHPKEFLRALEVIRQFPIRATDMVEVAPKWDPTGRTAALAANALTTILSDKLFESAD